MLILKALLSIESKWAETKSGRILVSHFYTKMGTPHETMKIMSLSKEVAITENIQDINFL